MHIFEKFPKEIADKFFIPDNINFLKFVRNWWHYYPESYVDLATGYLWPHIQDPLVQDRIYARVLTNAKYNAKYYESIRQRTEPLLDKMPAARRKRWENWYKYGVLKKKTKALWEIDNFISDLAYNLMMESDHDVEVGLHPNPTPSCFQLTLTGLVDEVGLHPNPTPSCFEYLMDLPLGYPSWFAAAYPDVIRYFSTPPCEIKEKIAREFESIFESVGLSKENLQDPDKFLDNPKITDKEGFFRPDFLYQIKECYKKLNPGKKLECQ